MSKNLSFEINDKFLKLVSDGTGKFTWLNKQSVKSSKGFIVQSVSRFTLEYREDKKFILIEVESDYAPGIKPCEKVNVIAFSRWNDGTSISQIKQQEIMQNFIEAMEFQGISVIIE
jgi:hypothetical protein